MLLLALGMLIGAAMPSLDTAPPTRLGVHAASLASALPAPRALVAPVRDVPDAAAPAAAAAVVPERHQPSPAAPTPLASSTTPASTTAATVATPRPRVEADPRARQVLAVVRAYERAWTRMDASATRTVMPSSDVGALTRGFSAKREQRLTLSDCRVSGNGPKATASCAGTLRYRPRKGDHSTRVERGRWQFRVERTAQRWVITDVDAAAAGRASN